MAADANIAGCRYTAKTHKVFHGKKMPMRQQSPLGPGGVDALITAADIPSFIATTIGYIPTCNK
jgi:hypothetical protein